MSRNSFLKVYHELPVTLKCTIWMAICQFLQKGISIFTTPIFTRILPSAEYGRISVFSSWESILTILITLSSAHAIMNLCVKYEHTEFIQSSITGLNITVALVFALLIALFIKPILSITGLSISMIICMVVYCFFDYVIRCWTQFKHYSYSYKPVVFEVLIYTLVVSIGSVMTVLFVTRTAEAKIIPQVVTTVVIGLILIIKTFHRDRTFYNYDIWKYTLCFCVPQIPHYFSEIILMSSDRIMIDRMCGASDVAVYSIAYSVGSLINMVTGSVNSSFAPYQFHKIEEKDYKTLAKNTNIVIAFVGLCLCSVMLFGREIILIFGGEKYIEGTPLIIPIALGVFFNYVFQLFARVQEYYEQKYTIVIASVSCAVLNIILNYIFIGKYGYQAAAYTTFVCYFVFCILHYLFYRMACKKYVGQVIYDVKALAFISVALIVAAVGIGFISKLVVVKYILLITAVAVIIWQRKRIVNLIKVLREKD